MNNLKIKIIGLGGGGSNMVTYANEFVTNEKIELSIMNTDFQAIETSQMKNYIQLGEKTTRGLGRGMKPEIGEKSALESQDEFKNYVKDSDLIIFAAGLGGGTGTGRIKIFSEIAKNLKIPHISVITLPFVFEGKKRMRLAKESLKSILTTSNSTIIIKNDKLIENTTVNLSIKDAFKVVDDVLVKSMLAISNIILNYNENDINVDFADIKTLLSFTGCSIINVLKEEGAGSRIKTIEKSLEDNMIENYDLTKSQGVLVNFKVNGNYSLISLQESVSYLNDQLNDEVRVFFGTNIDNSMKDNEVETTIFITGLEDKIFEENKKEQIDNKQILSYNNKKNLNVNEINNLDTPTWLRQKLG